MSLALFFILFTGGNQELDKIKSLAEDFNPPGNAG
jgi:hypothetical protein